MFYKIFVFVAAILLPVFYPVCAVVTGEEVVVNIDVRELVETGVLDGLGETKILEDGETLEVKTETWFTIWHPEKIESSFTLEFDCFLPEKNAKMLIFLHAMPNDKSSILDWESDGRYPTYTSGMQAYTLGINRGEHTGLVNFCPHSPGRPDVANLRRIGLFGYDEASIQKIGEERREMGPGRMWMAPTWKRWNETSSLVSAREAEAGLNEWYSHKIKITPPYISYYVNENLVMETVDRVEPPLSEGYVGFRCMSPGKRFMMRNIKITAE